MNVNPPDWEYHHLSELLRCGDDGVWYIDYLRAFPDEMDDPDEMLVDSLLEHKKLIAKMVESSRGELTGVGVKANWLARYHNEYVAELDAGWLRDRDCSREELMVNVAGFSTMFVFPPPPK